MKSLCLEDYKKRYKRYYKRDRTAEACKCTTCKETHADCFYPNCKTLCKKHYHPEARAAANRTTADYEMLLAEQGGTCATCGQTPKELSVERLEIHAWFNKDLVRGLLCERCRRIFTTCGEPLLLNMARYITRPPLGVTVSASGLQGNFEIVDEATREEAHRLHVEKLGTKKAEAPLVAKVEEITEEPSAESATPSRKRKAMSQADENFLFLASRG